MDRREMGGGSEMGFTELLYVYLSTISVTHSSGCNVVRHIYCIDVNISYFYLMYVYILIQVPKY